jgi:pyruvate-ferredoxin/flavodoxin oxidoreductase
MQVSSLDCTGCGSCVEVCPVKEKALEMAPFVTPCKNAVRWDYMSKNVKSRQHLVEVDKNVKNSQFATPLFEFSGACAGCGETPYIKLITQLFGDRMMVANATGCSSIYGGSCPSMPYCTNEKGQGPAWANSLFEDNAEYGLGMALGLNTMRDKLASLMQEGLECPSCSGELKELFKLWLENSDNAAKTKEIAVALKPLAAACGCNICKEILALEQYLVKKSVWIFGGDGWGYDIGYGGLDHVIASGENVNILVMDTEVYSNTGGQASKATPTGAIAKFAASGKKIRKKDLGAIAMTYGYVYVAQVAMGANQSQYLKAIKEAEAYDGPSLIIAYSPCISHGLKVGMGRMQDEMKRAVECGYWQLWRYNPALEAEGQKPFMLDSKEPDWSKFRDFIMGEVRYNALTKMYPAQSEELFKAAEENAKWRYNSYLLRK